MFKVSPLQIYNAGLIFCSPSSHLLDDFKSDASEMFEVKSWLPMDCRELDNQKSVFKSKTRSLVFSPDNTRVVSVSGSGSIFVWQLETGRFERTLDSKCVWTRNISFSPDGSRLASGSTDGKMLVWDLATGECQHTLDCSSNSIWYATFSPSGAMIACACSGGRVLVWDAHTGQCLHVFQGHLEATWSISFSPDESVLAALRPDYSIRLWCLASGQCRCLLRGHEECIVHIVFSPDGSRLVTQSYFGTIRVWDVRTGKCRHVFEGHGKFSTVIQFSPDGSLLAACHRNTTRLWAFEADQSRLMLLKHDAPIHKLVFSLDRLRLAASSRDNTVHVWDMRSGNEVQRCHANHITWYTNIDFNHDGTALLIGGDSISIEQQKTPESPIIKSPATELQCVALQIGVEGG